MTDKCMFLPGCAKRVDNCIWISLAEFNGLAKIDVYTGKIFFIGEFPLEKRGYQIHSQIREYNNKLFFSPWNTNNIAIYDQEKKEFRKIPMEDCGHLEAGRVVAAVQEDKNLFFVLENAREIIELDMQQEVIKKRHILLEKDVAIPPFEYMRPIRTQNDIWGISEQGNISWKFNLASRECKKIELFHENVSIYTGCGSDDYMWLLAEGSVLYQITSTGEQDKEYNLSEILRCELKSYKEEKDQERNHFNSIFLKNCILIVWFEKKEIIQIPFKKDLADLNEYKVINYDRAEFSFGEQLIMSENDKMIVFDGEDIKEIEVKKTPDFVNDILKVPNKNLMEGGCIQLEDLLTCLEQSEGVIKTLQDGVISTAGSRIYSAVE